MKTKRDRVRLLSLLIPPLVALLLCAGCGKTDENKSKEIFDEVNAKLPSAETAEPSKTPKTVEKPEPPPKPTMPQVKLTEKDAADCLIKVGDLMPNAALRDVEGKPVELHSLRGKKLTVVCFCSAKDLSGLQAIDELGKYVAAPYLKKGVAVIGINVGDAPQTFREKATLAGADFPMLLDPQSAYFKRVAVQTLPRVYLLDAEGKVLWFDIEYSRSMRRDLLQGIDFTMGK